MNLASGTNLVTNLKGGAFVRYRVGDMIKVLSRTNETLT